MYTLYKYNKWPHRILIEFNNKVVASTDRYYSSTRFDSAEFADAQFENIAQLMLLEQLIEHANAGLKQEQNNVSST